MNRRTFTKSIAASALGLGANALANSAFAQETSGAKAPYDISIMLWTVFKDLPFEQRLEKVSEAGFKNVELVGEYRKWSEDDFTRANAKRKELGLHFDTTAGLRHGVGNPSDRDAVLADIRAELTIMEKIECPAVIVMSGNVVPGMPRAMQHKSCIEGLKRGAELVQGLTMEGRWFWGGYDEFGIDVKMIRAGKDPVVLGTDLYALQSPSTRELHVFGGGFSPAWKPQDIDLGPGVEVSKITKSTPTELTIQVSVAPNLPVSMRDVTIRGVSAVKAFAVYDKIAMIKVMPDANFARLGGTIVAKQYAQFEAVAFAVGSEGQDGIELGPVSANWSLEEFFSTPDDDDVSYVGTINDSGLFTPALEGPNPKRRKQANNLPIDNYGDVYVTASFQPESGEPMKAQAYLVVGVPLYVHYDQPEVSQ